MVKLDAILSQVDLSRQQFDWDLKNGLRWPCALTEYGETKFDGKLLSDGDCVEMLLVVVADAILGYDGFQWLSVSDSAAE